MSFIILPVTPERPELPPVIDFYTAALQIVLLQTYAREWEQWGVDVKKMVEGE